MAQFTQRSLTDLIEAAGETVGTNTVYWTADEKRDAINEAICMWQVMTGRWVARVPMNTAETFNRLPNDMISAQRVKILPKGGNPQTVAGTVLVMTSLPELDLAAPGWESTVGTPTMWAPIGINEIALYPRPTEEILLLIEGIKEAPRLFSDGDFIDLGDEDLTELVRYVHHYLTFKEAGAEFNASQEDVVALFEAAGQQNARLKMTAPYRRYMGLQREEGERSARGAAVIGVRTNE
jgi:hypothetical protein